MAVFKKGDNIRNKHNGLTYIITDVLTASYEIKGEPCQKWLLPFEDEGEWELISNKNMENIIMDKFSEQDKEFILKIARHFSNLYKERTEAISHLADVIEYKKLSRDYTGDKTSKVDW